MLNFNDRCFYWQSFSQHETNKTKNNEKKKKKKDRNLSVYSLQVLLQLPITALSQLQLKDKMGFSLFNYCKTGIRIAVYENELSGGG